MRVNFNPNFIQNNHSIRHSAQKSYKTTPLAFDNFTFRGKDDRYGNHKTSQVDNESSQQEIDERARIKTMCKKYYDKGYNKGREDSQSNSNGFSGIFVWLALIFLYLEISSVSRNVNSIEFDLNSKARNSERNQETILENVEDMQQNLDSTQEQINMLIELLENDLEAQIKALPPDDEEAQELKYKLESLKKDLEEYHLEHP